MTHINATGNLTRTPELREGSKGAYCYANVAVNDRYRDSNDQWQDGPATYYDLVVFGNQAENLVRTAQNSGNIRVQFSGDFTREKWTEGQREGVNNRVRVDDIGVSLRGNIDVDVTKRSAADAGQDQHTDRATAFPSPASAAVATPPTAAAAAASPAAGTDHGGELQR